jgi:beta-glucosidase
MNKELFEDKNLSINKRVEDLINKLNIQEKIGLMFQTMSAYYPIDKEYSQLGLPSLEYMVKELKINHFNLIGSFNTAEKMAEFYNDAQTMAQKVGHGIPITFSTDPRNGVSDNPLAAMLSGPFSQWPESLGLAALRDPQRTYEFADSIRKEYTAVGIRLALHPQIDLSTEYRWARIAGTFGEDANLTSKLGIAYIKGLQTDKFGKNSVSCMAKHFPGGGPQGNNGEDPHFEYGKDQIYPDNNWEYHLLPFKAAIKAGVRQIMPYYGRPLGLKWEEVGFGFNKDVLTNLLKKQLKFNGIVCTDWGLITDVEIFGKPFPARAWGMESKNRCQRALKILDAGADQFGGESCTDVVMELIKNKLITENRIDISIKKILKEKFELGLFDENRFVDSSVANSIVNNIDIKNKAYLAQAESVTMLKNAGILPLKKGLKIYSKSIKQDELGDRGQIVKTLKEADVAILRIDSAFEKRDGFDGLFNAGSIEYTQKQIEEINKISKIVPTIIDVFIQRPVVFTPVISLSKAFTLTYGTGNNALLDVYYGKFGPKGKLPFDLPSSQNAV